MICKDLGLIFIHIPKTAGQSIERFFLSMYGLTWDQRSKLFLRHNADPKLGPERLAHLTATEYVKCGHISNEDFANFYKFSFVRNPWERLVSEYHFHNYSNKYSFKDFVFQGFPEESMKDDYRHIMPQYDFIYNSQGKLLVNFVGRFENLQTDFDVICKKLTLIKTKLPHVNPSKLLEKTNNVLKFLLPIKSRKHRYTEYYDKESLEVVTEMYRKDIHAFGYKFGQ